MLRVFIFLLARLMPLWIVIFALIGFRWSKQFMPVSHATGAALGFVLFVMGLTLDQERLKTILRSPWQVIMGSLGKWVITPLVSVVLAWCFFGLHTELANGVIMAGVVPSGTSANLNALIGGGDLSLSVAMSALDTFLGPLLTPALSKWFAGTTVHLGYLAFVLKTTRIVFIPLVCGIALQWRFPVLGDKVRTVAPILSAVALYIVVLGVVAPASTPLQSHMNELSGVVLCVVIQIVAQMVLGYLYARVARFDERASRSMIFEVGICNTALAAVLATAAFGPLAGVAAMTNMVCNLTIGSLVAVLLAVTPVRRERVLGASSTVDG